MRGRCLLKKNSGGTLPCCRTGARVQTTHARHALGPPQRARRGGERLLRGALGEGERGPGVALFRAPLSERLSLSLSEASALLHMETGQRAKTHRLADAPPVGADAGRRHLVGSRGAGCCLRRGREEENEGLSLSLLLLARANVCVYLFSSLCVE